MFVVLRRDSSSANNLGTQVDSFQTFCGTTLQVVVFCFQCVCLCIVRLRFESEQCVWKLSLVRNTPTNSLAWLSFGVTSRKFWNKVTKALQLTGVLLRKQFIAKAGILVSVHRSFSQSGAKLEFRKGHKKNGRSFASTETLPN